MAAVEHCPDRTAAAAAAEGFRWKVEEGEAGEEGEGDRSLAELLAGVAEHLQRRCLEAGAGAGRHC